MLYVLAGSCIACVERATTSDQVDVDALQQLEVQQQFRIGSVDDPDLGFSRIGNVVVDRSGRIYVFESHDLQIRVYEPNGTLLHRIGRIGSGPGEFRSSARFGVVGDTLWAIEWITRRLSLFTRDGDLLSAVQLEGVLVPIQTPGRSALILPIHMREDGFFTSSIMNNVMSREDTSRVSSDTIRIPRLLFNARGEVVDTIGWRLLPPPEKYTLGRVKVGSSLYTKPFPPGEYPLEIELPDGDIVVDRQLATSARAGVFRVTRKGLSGDTVFSHSFRYQPVGYSAAILDSIARRAAHVTGGLAIFTGSTVEMVQRHAEDSAEARRIMRSSLGFPEFQPPIQSDHLDQSGGFWLRREDNGGPMFRWIVFDSVGAPVGEVQLPRGLRVAWSHGMAFLAVEHDDLDVPWLVRYEMRLARR